MQRVFDVSNSGDDRRKSGLADDVLQSSAFDHPALNDALGDPKVRKWARVYLLPRMPGYEASMLAITLLRWFEDFRPDRRDRSTSRVVEALSNDAIREHLSLLAGSNASGTLWERVSSLGEQAMMESVVQVLEHGDERARETTLHHLVLDPYGPEHLTRDQQDRVLLLALNDQDPEIRGLAAEVVAADMPEQLLDQWDSVPLDDSERMRMAFWRAALVHQPERAIESAGALTLNFVLPRPARRTALLALGEYATTREVSPVLQALLQGDDEVLAGDAAQLMWRYHRAPDIASAAAESRFQSVRDLAQRLLHPEMGSPAAGGSRPGDPTRTTDIFKQITPPDEPER